MDRDVKQPLSSIAPAAACHPEFQVAIIILSRIVTDSQKEVKKDLHHRFSKLLKSIGAIKKNSNRSFVLLGQAQSHCWHVV